MKHPFMGLMPVLLLAGCASIPADHGFSRVQHDTQTRGAPAIATAADAQTRDQVDALLSRPLSADSATMIALLNNPDLRITYARLGLSGAEVLRAGRLSNPALSAGLGFTGAVGAVTRLTYGLAQDFASLLLLPSRTRYAKAQFARTQMQVSAAVLRKAAEVQGDYFAYVGARELAAMQQQIAAALDTRARLAQRYYQAGNISALELYLQQSQAMQAQLDALRANAAATQARIVVNRDLGLGADAPQWTAPRRLPLPVSREDDLATLQQLAQRRRLDLQAADTDVTALEHFLDATRTYRLLGGLTVGVDGERGTDGVHSFGPTLALELPIFNQGQSRVLSAQSLLALARAQRASLKLDIANDVHSAYARMDAARHLADVYRRRYLPLREAVLNSTQQEVNYMLKSPFDLILAREQEFDAYRGDVEAVRDYWTARADLSRAVGTRLPSDARIGDRTLPDEAPLPADIGRLKGRDKTDTQGPMSPSPSMKAMPGMSGDDPRQMDMQHMDMPAAPASTGGAR